jgi:hypothetical protein
MSKPTLRKPAASRVSEMVEIAATQRFKDQRGMLCNPSQAVLITATLTYPIGHPMRVYRDAKKVAKGNK